MSINISVGEDYGTNWPHHLFHTLFNNCNAVSSSPVERTAPNLNTFITVIITYRHSFLITRVGLDLVTKWLSAIYSVSIKFPGHDWNHTRVPYNSRKRSLCYRCEHFFRILILNSQNFGASHSGGALVTTYRLITDDYVQYRYSVIAYSLWLNYKLRCYRSVASQLAS